MTKKIKKVSIIGSGPAGYTAAIYSARSGLEPLMISGLEPGGQLTITTDVENFPGFEKPVQGPWLMDQMKKQAESFGTQILTDFVKEVDFKTFPFKIRTEKLEIESYSTIIATGAKAKWLGVEGEKKFMGLGVSACATCDGFFFKGKNVVVVGGGNTAVEEALFLSNLCKKVTLVHRRDRLRAEQILQKRLGEKKNVEILWNSVVDKIIGDESKRCISSIIISNNLSKKKKELNLDGIFVAIGHSPTTEIFREYINMDEDGYIMTKPNSTKTNIEGVFAAGDVADKVYRQAVTAAGLGCMGAMEAKIFLNNKKII
ncbi:MAG: thioredoxin-disulfide reductase [Rickettsiales bacterium]|nr:thioredoxin-disulfide reductase [Rickettsiales bacterium]|tara:strand:+ start:311 stop:1255 length:945 start_codon:yes stop_codon:yes gene_type:complete